MNTTKPALAAVAVLLFATVFESVAAPLACPDPGSTDANILPGEGTFSGWTWTSEPPLAGSFTVYPPGTTEIFLPVGRSDFPIPVFPYPIPFGAITEIGPSQVSVRSPPFEVDRAQQFVFSACSAVDIYEAPPLAEMGFTLTSETGGAVALLKSMGGHSPFLGPNAPDLNEILVSLPRGTFFVEWRLVNVTLNLAVGTASVGLFRQEVPEPSSIILLSTVAVGLAIVAARRRWQRQTG